MAYPLQSVDFDLYLQGYMTRIVTFGTFAQ